MADVTPLCVSGDGRVRPFSSSAGDTLVGAGGGGSLPFADDEPQIANAADATKQVRIDASEITAGETRVLKAPDADGTIALAEHLSSLIDRSSGSGANSRTATIGVGDLPADGSVVMFRARGGDNGTLSLTIGGAAFAFVDGTNANDQAGDRGWSLDGEIERLSATSVGVHVTVLWFGRDEDAGSPWEAAPHKRQTLSLSVDLDTDDCDVVVASTGGKVESCMAWALTHAAAGAGGRGGLPLYSAPDFSTFSWVNQGSATRAKVYRADGGHPFELLSAPQAPETNLRMLMQSMPATPYTVEIGFYRTAVEENYARIGIAARDSTTGRIVLASTNSASWSVQKFNTATSHNSDYNTQTNWNLKISNWVFLRLGDDGTNFAWSYSWDGFTWITMNTQSRTNWLASPDEIGVSFNARNNVAGGDEFVVFHWRVH